MVQGLVVYHSRLGLATRSLKTKNSQKTNYLKLLVNFKLGKFILSLCQEIKYHCFHSRTQGAKDRLQHLVDGWSLRWERKSPFRLQTRTCARAGLVPAVPVVLFWAALLQVSSHGASTAAHGLLFQHMAKRRFVMLQLINLGGCWPCW